MKFRNFRPFLILYVALAGCDLDVFDLSCRPIVGAYCLDRWEDGSTYYLRDRAVEESGGGAIEGVVERIGWNGEYIIAKRRAIFRGDPDGWMVIEVGNKTIRGPYDDLELAGMREAQGVVPIDPDKAWRQLR